MDSLFNNEIVKKGDGRLDADYETFLEDGNVSMEDVQKTVDFLNNFFVNNYMNEIGDYPSLFFRNGYCAYFAAMLNLIYPEGVMTVNKGSDHVLFVINTDPFGPVAYDSMNTGWPEDLEVKGFFSPEYHRHLYERENQIEIEKLCFEALKAYAIYKNKNGMNEEKTK